MSVLLGPTGSKVTLEFRDCAKGKEYKVPFFLSHKRVCARDTLADVASRYLRKHLQPKRTTLPQCTHARTHARTHAPPRAARFPCLSAHHAYVTNSSTIRVNNVPCSFWVHMIHMHNIHIHPYTHTYIHSYIRTYIHTYIHTYIEVGYKCHSLRPMLQIPYTTLQSFAWGVSR